MNYLNSLNIQKYCFLLLPISLITGPFLTDLSIVIISICFLFNFKKKMLNDFKNFFLYFFFIFYIYLILNGLFNNPNIDTIKISFSYVRYIIFVYACVYLVQENKYLLKHFFYISLACFSFLIIDGFIQYFYGKNILGYPIGYDSRVSSLFKDELILGSYLSRLLPVIFGLYIILRSEIRFHSIFIILIFILVETLIFLSGERTAFFYVNLSAIYSIIMLKNYKILRSLMLITSFFLIFIVSIIDSSAKKRIIDKTVEQFFYDPKIASEITFNDEKNSKLDFTIQGRYIFSEQHTHHYISAYKMFANNKWFGVGIKNFRNFCDNEKYKISDLSCSTHPHNTYIQLLSELGIFGTLFFITLFIIFIFYSLKHLIGTVKKKYYFNDFEIMMMSAMILPLWPIAPTGNFFNNWLTIISLIPIIFFYWSFKSRTKVLT